MAKDKNEHASGGGGNAPQEATKEKSERREIKGGIPYTTSPGVLKKALEQIISAERPDKFGANFMATILRLTGGAARAVPPFLKKMQFLGADGTPTQLYSKFKTDSGRTQAAYEGLRNAFAELFRRNEYIHKVDENGVKDTIVEITGLKKTDPIVRMMYASFDAVRSFIAGEISAAPERAKSEPEDEVEGASDHDNGAAGAGRRIGLSYQINIILPETDNVAVFNAIFKSLRENLLR